MAPLGFNASDENENGTHWCLMCGPPNLGAIAVWTGAVCRGPILPGVQRVPTGSLLEESLSPSQLPFYLRLLSVSVASSLYAHTCVRVYYGCRCVCHTHSYDSK